MPPHGGLNLYRRSETDPGAALSTRAALGKPYKLHAIQLLTSEEKDFVVVLKP
jgi:hypothetical protein